MSLHENLLGEPPATYLPEDPEAREALAQATDPRQVAARFPYSAAWAALAERAFAADKGRLRDFTCM